MQTLISPESIRYLKSPVEQFGLTALLIGAGIYTTVTSKDPYPYAIYVALLAALALAAVLLRTPRWVSYGLLLLAFGIHVFAFVHIVANQEHDSLSTRDAAVEVTAQALLRGENAWNASPGVGVTTGPTSILLAIPFVSAFGQINWLSFIFWALFFLVLLACDVHYRNNSWPILTLIFVLGLFEIEHTLYWSLEELYYPILYLALAYALAERRRWGWVGALCAASALSRPSYLFLLMGFGLWYLFSRPFNWRPVIQMGLGFALGGIVILLPFVIVGGSDLWANNPWRHAFDFSGAAWPETNLIFRSLNRLNAQIGSDAMRWVKLGLTLLTMTGIAWGLQRANVRHPFWHIAAGAFIAHTLVWLPAQLPKDYTLMFVLPAMLAVAMTPSQATKPGEAAI